MSTASCEQPLPSNWSVEQGLNAYLEENGFTVKAYDAPRTPASFLGLRFSVPNTPRHRWAIMLHDLHHVATGYGTDPAGEGQISAWECRRGLRPLGLYVGSIGVSWRAARSHRCSDSHASRLARLWSWRVTVS